MSTDDQRNVRFAGVNEKLTMAGKLCLNFIRVYIFARLRWTEGHHVETLLAQSSDDHDYGKLAFRNVVHFELSLTPLPRGV